ncbi:MAG TPA: hypothetical protein VMU15_08770 [Anaeromyxobacter sp.]|nr:hypothetical protein [Anaeromyxobacter sp.]
MPSALAMILAAGLAAATAEPRTPASPEPAAATAAPREPSALAPAAPRAPEGAPTNTHPGAEPAVEGKSPGERGEARIADPLPSRTPADRASSEAAISAAARATTTATPPSLSARALLDELRRSARDRQGEQGSLAEQRKKLEALAQEIEKSRAALREETARLQAAVATAAKAEKPGPGGQKAGTSSLDTLAKTTKGMKAEQAAAMLTRLDRGLAAAILNHMRPGDSALVLEKMEPATAAALLALLAGKDRT